MTDREETKYQYSQQECSKFDECSRNGKYYGNRSKCERCNLYYQHIFVGECSRDYNNGKVERNVPFDSCDDYYDYEDYKD